MSKSEVPRLTLDFSHLSPHPPWLGLQKKSQDQNIKSKLKTPGLVPDDDESG